MSSRTPDRRLARAARPGARRRLLAPALAVLLAPGLAGAAQYETFVDVDDEDDLFELSQTGDISGETYETLIELLRRGVNLNKATREELFTLPNLTYKHVDAIIRYRQEAGFIHDPAALVVAGVLDKGQLEAIAAFIYIVEPTRRYSATSGKVRLRTAYSPPDRRAPAMVLDGQLQTARHLRMGFAGVLTRNRVDDVRYDPSRDALSADGPRPRVYLPKFYVQWDDDNYSVLAGTYRIGFGQRLTFDNTRNYTPNGIYRDNTVYPRPVRLARACRETAGELPASPCAGDLDNTYSTPDFRWQETLQGVAAGIKKLQIGSGWMQAYAWTSVQARSIYQYKLYDPSVCDDPRNDDDPRCGTPGLYKRQDDPLAPTSELAYQTLPRMFREHTSGGNVSYFFNRRSWIGATGYGTTIKWLTGGKDYDFQEWSRTPFGGPFGAVGLNGAWGYRWSDLGFEVSRSFDSMARPAFTGEPGDTRGGGGFAAILRHTATWGRHEIETIVRWYDTDYANPYARPLSSPDVYEGQRARDELGGRVRYTGRPNRKSNVRAYVNFWVSPSTKAPAIIVHARGEYAVTRWWMPAVWAQYQDKDMRANGWTHCFGGDPTASSLGGDDDIGGDFGDDAGAFDYSNLRGEPVKCRGEQFKANVQMAFQPHPRVKIVPRYQHRLIGDPNNRDLGPDMSPYTNEPELPRGRFRHDSQAWLTLTSRPVDPLRLRARVRYLSMDITNNYYLEQSLWTYADVGYLIQKRFLVQLRYDLYVWLDKRESTLARIPSPENRFMVTLEGRF